MRVLFLDVDGVLNTPKTIGKFGFDFIDDILVALVARIVRETDCKIVLSSWGRIEEKDFLLVKDSLTQFGLEIHDSTPYISKSGAWTEGGHTKRCEEIQAWLNNNNNTVDVFAILDDDKEAEIEGSFFHTDENRGITVEIAEKIIAHFTKS